MSLLETEAIKSMPDLADKKLIAYYAFVGIHPDYRGINLSKPLP
jgi:hypothetical protein